ncbi:histidinol-phosphate transaminase [Porphyromonas sp.]|uniref:pyridoxal phosphate-dependent aminotransferase n=1 Tax=Porphyromonas sp. TaxID=1924944 RepID=UPI0026DBD9AD|nr:aminotransferase class I/II-fold pyridoxal phosphate-dependent enzyme [Porphyromonas sp.]MDO4695178.1 aminotransferase class I/II-fold pyridoxal phosphate-dependent enzyme [Porphyromonas sp.]MDO4770924.1 aminotransferase class I/II-fold pyridoxal phosphate-dependent enzyme [Porphyromonas sp.]
MIHGHGDDAYKYLNKIIGDFSSNVPYCHHGDQVAEHIKDNLRCIHNYPDPSASKLTALLKDHHQLTSANDLLVTNGSAESFYLLGHLFESQRSIVTYPSFAEYEDACTLYKHKIEFVPIEALATTKIHQSKTIWFALPNNPDGFIIPIDAVEELCRKNPDTYIIVDSAYSELCPGISPIVKLHDQYPNLITIHSLTKTFAIPGLRLGYVIASAKIISQLKHFRLPWSVNSVALIAGEFIVKNYDALQPDAEALCKESRQFQKKLSQIDGIEVVPSQCSFFLCRLKKGTSAELKEYLVAQHGLLIRNADNFRGLTNQHFRISTQGEERNDLLCQAISMYIQSL